MVDAHHRQSAIRSELNRHHRHLSALRWLGAKGPMGEPGITCCILRKQSSAEVPPLPQGECSTPPALSKGVRQNRTQQVLQRANGLAKDDILPPLAALSRRCEGPPPVSSVLRLPFPPGVTYLTCMQDAHDVGAFAAMQVNTQ
ncbi:unnamed protein product [Diplocarpon coronariae]